MATENSKESISVIYEDYDIIFFYFLNSYNVTHK